MPFTNTFYVCEASENYNKEMKIGDILLLKKIDIEASNIALHTIKAILLQVNNKYS